MLMKCRQCRHLWICFSLALICATRESDTERKSELDLPYGGIVSRSSQYPIFLKSSPPTQKRNSRSAVTNYLGSTNKGENFVAGCFFRSGTEFEEQPGGNGVERNHFVFKPNETREMKIGQLLYANCSSIHSIM